MRAVPLNRGLALTTLDDVLPEIQRINESIQSILADIKSNTGKANIQTKESNLPPLPKQKKTKQSKLKFNKN